MKSLCRSRILAVFAHCAHALLKHQAAGLGGYEPRVWPLAEGASGALRSFCPLQARFNKSVSVSGEVSSLAGDRVVSHERSLPADLPRQDC
jgi:hypothetical protein